MLLQRIKLQNLLSFGPGGLDLPLQGLNVLIGPNGSGKSNLIEAVSLLQSAPRVLAAPVRDGGGIRDWLWKGEKNPCAKLEVIVENPQKGRIPLRHILSFTETAQKFEFVDERIEDESPTDSSKKDPYFYYRFQHNHPILNVRGDVRTLKRESVKDDESILSQKKDAEQYPEITYLGEKYSEIKIYREWCFGRYTPARQPQKADNRNDKLEEDFSNLGLVLNRLSKDIDVKKTILESLNQLYEGIDDYDEIIEGGTVQVFFREGRFSIPATRLSDGTLRYLCLLAVLCDPKPAPLICIEEPELGLHPDVMPTLGRLLREASKKTQLIVTTHSDVLVDELTEEPEAVIICEKVDGGSTMRRLDQPQLEAWLKKYRLGQLWTKGEIGGVRW
jgi:predicted ATPase